MGSLQCTASSSQTGYCRNALMNNIALVEAMNKLCNIKDWQHQKKIEFPIASRRKPHNEDHMVDDLAFGVFVRFLPCSGQRTNSIIQIIWIRSYIGHGHMYTYVYIYINISTIYILSPSNFLWFLKSHRGPACIKTIYMGFYCLMVTHPATATWPYYWGVKRFNISPSKSWREFMNLMNNLC